MLTTTLSFTQRHEMNLKNATWPESNARLIRALNRAAFAPELFRNDRRTIQMWYLIAEVRLKCAEATKARCSSDEQ